MANSMRHTGRNGCIARGQPPWRHLAHVLPGGEPATRDPRRLDPYPRCFLCLMRLPEALHERG